MDTTKFHTVAQLAGADLVGTRVPFALALLCAAEYRVDPGLIAGRAG
ncbi:MAG: hypothetical protein ABSF61_09185 [Anaerolineales bacterium]|jgi:hypothetical protein